MRIVEPSSPKSPGTLRKQSSSTMVKNNGGGDSSPSGFMPIGFKPSRPSVLQARDEPQDPQLIMVKGNSGLLSFNDSFGNKSIKKIEKDAFINMQRTITSNYAVKLDPNYQPPPNEDSP